MDVLDRMYQLHSGSASSLVYNFGGNLTQLITEWEGRIGESIPLAELFGQNPTLTLDDAANGLYWDIVKLAKKLYFADMTRETAVAVANSITPVGKLHLADDIEFTDVEFAKVWSDAHEDQQPICRIVDIG